MSCFEKKFDSVKVCDTLDARKIDTCKLCFSAKNCACHSAPHWCVKENANNNLEFSYGNVSKVVLTKEGNVDISGVVLESTETLTISDDLRHDPSVLVTTTFIDVNVNNKKPFGFLADGVADGQIKRIVPIRLGLTNPAVEALLPSSSYSLKVNNFKSTFNGKTLVVQPLLKGMFVSEPTDPSVFSFPSYNANLGDIKNALVFQWRADTPQGAWVLISNQ